MKRWIVGGIAVGTLALAGAAARVLLGLNVTVIEIDSNGQTRTSPAKPLLAPRPPPAAAAAATSSNMPPSTPPTPPQRFPLISFSPPPHPPSRRSS